MRRTVVIGAVGMVVVLWASSWGSAQTAKRAGMGAAAAVEWRVMMVSGEVRSAGISDVGMAGVVRLCRDGSGGRGIRAGDGKDVEKPLVLVLRDGSRIVGGAMAGTSAESLVWNSPLVGVVTVPIKAVRGVARGEEKFKASRAEGTEDILTLENGDSVKGAITDMSTDTVTVTPTAGEATVISWRTVREMQVADLGGGGNASKGSSAGTTAYRVELTDGSVVMAGRVAVIKGGGGMAGGVPLGEKLVLELAKDGEAVGAGGGRAEVSTAGVRLVEKLGGEGRTAGWSLALLVPEEVVHMPYLTARRPPVIESVTTSWAGGAAGGGAGGGMVTRVMGLTSYTKMTWGIPAGAKSLRFWVGLEGGATRGQAVLRVVGDGKVIWESVLKSAGEMVGPVLVPVEGLERMSVECDFGASVGVQSRVRIIEPMLLGSAK